MELTRAEPQTLTAVLSALEEAGCRLTSGPDHILLESRGPLQSIPTVRTAPYPGFPTDGGHPDGRPDWGAGDHHVCGEYV